MSTKINEAINNALMIANNNTHGYDQRNRWGPDYDCSSMLITAWERAGVPVKSRYGATRTGNMYNAFIKAGFRDVTSSVDMATGNGMQPGDVLLKPYGHTEMIINEQHELVGAHIAENNSIYAEQEGDQTGREISVTPYRNYPWTYALRYPGGTGSIVADKTTVISDNRYLSKKEMQVNARYVASVLLRNGWTINAVAAILGNMESESHINPGIWQSLNEGNLDGGFGLVQWTPATKLIDWCNGKGVDYRDIDSQLGRILWEMDEGVQYYATDNYPESFYEFSRSEKSAAYLAAAFLFNYERPADPKPEERGSQAEYWYDYLLPLLEGGTLIPGRKRRQLSLLMMYMATRKAGVM